MLIVLSVLCYALLAASAPQVQLGKTKLIGRDVTGLKQDFFGGIPFAEPPVGALRLERPVLKTDIDADEFDARNFGLPCLQTSLAADEMSEDCLSINIFRPTGLSSGDSLPIMFWTYGGGFAGGASSNFNGSNIVAQSVTRGTPIIYVNYNYRVGPLGFPQGQEAESRGQLNLGLRDQLTALEWVQQNIGLFGGDKTKVTIFGESAGSMMTNLMLLNSSISNFAWAAISESGSASSPVIYNASARESTWQDFVAGTTGCESVAGTQNTFGCLQAAYALAIEDFPFYPVLDGPSGVLPDLPTQLWAKGKFATIPFISGTNLDEGTGQQTNRSFTDEDIKDYIQTTYSAFPPYIPDAILDRFLELYPNDPSLVGDLTFDAQRRTWTQAAARAGVKSYGYQFAQNSSSWAPYFGVTHSAELEFIYGELDSSTEPASSILLGEMMVDYWVSFSTSLDPNDGLGTSRPNWPQYTPDNEAC
ncbi:alpha/beta-hydrolase [Guyanagaster necrorhizus]|uniref:Carboxylic ester hydrolase n=1 Tax=Guyanagaster necrorhizus TaxID=856835 RepID=A0A9P7VSP2_9AGAR|nr:alpha/beta-hydrolase [Guyanagaster necrorhizus MCA 3950]KAG7445319.1 alpha/beta-hydrolase [Guyanagaster necrorhizus MCA 3950]